MFSFVIFKELLVLQGSIFAWKMLIKLLKRWSTFYKGQAMSLLRYLTLNLAGMKKRLFFVKYSYFEALYLRNLSTHWAPLTLKLSQI